MIGFVQAVNMVANPHRPTASMRFSGGPLDTSMWERDGHYLTTYNGYRYVYVIADDIWYYAGDGSNCFVTYDGREVEMLPFGPSEWKGWTPQGKITATLTYTDTTVFSVTLPDGKQGQGATLQDGVENATASKAV